MLFCFIGQAFLDFFSRSGELFFLATEVALIEERAC